jgi:hypothetical protein
MDAYLSTRSVLWLDPSDDFSVLNHPGTNFIEYAYNKSSNSLLKNFTQEGSSSSGITVKSYTNSRGLGLRYLSFNGQSYLESPWDFSYDNNTIYLVFKVNQVTNAFQSLISHHKDWEYRAGLAKNFMGRMRYKNNVNKTFSGSDYVHDHMYSSSKRTANNNINVSQDWHLLSISFRSGSIFLSVDGRPEQVIPNTFPQIKSTVTGNYLTTKIFNYEDNVYHKAVRFIRTNQQTNQAGFEPDVSNPRYWFPSKLNICCNHAQTQRLKADIAEMICIPTTDINPVANYLIKKWDIERA